MAESQNLIFYFFLLFLFLFFILAIGSGSVTPKNGISHPFGQNGGGPTFFLFFFFKKNKPQNKINKKYVSHVCRNFNGATCR
jgi:hypothetical protein